MLEEFAIWSGEIAVVGMLDFIAPLIHQTWSASSVTALSAPLISQDHERRCSGYR